MAIQQKGKRTETTKTVNTNTDKTTVTNTPRQKMVEEAAYYNAEKRGFQPGRELDDWFSAESHITAILQRTTK